MDNKPFMHKINKTKRLHKKSKKNP